MKKKKHQIALYDEYKTYCALKKYYDKNFDVVSYSDKCIPESADNLVKNGYGEYGDNTNFTSLSYDKENGYFYIKSSKNDFLYTSNKIKIDVNKRYYQSVEASADKSSIYYIGLLEFDYDALWMQPDKNNYILNTTTYLTEDLNNGDMVVHLNDVSNFRSVSSNGLIFWNYKDSTGYTYPEETYSRNVWQNLYTYDNIDKENNTITLNEAWNHGKIKKGTKLSQTNDNGYNYGVLANKSLSTNMTLYENNITGVSKKNPRNAFRYGTHYIKYLLLTNYANVKDVTTYYKNFVIKEVR